MSQPIADNGKTAAIISYITIVGWLISFFALNKPKTSLATYHLRQTLLLFICAVTFQIAVYILAMILPALAGILAFVGIGFWYYG